MAKCPAPRDVNEIRFPTPSGTNYSKTRGCNSEGKIGGNWTNGALSLRTESRYHWLCSEWKTPKN